jgi:hypothetical protein
MRLVRWLRRFQFDVSGLMTDRLGLIDFVEPSELETSSIPKN